MPIVGCIVSLAFVDAFCTIPCRLWVCVCVCVRGLWARTAVKFRFSSALRHCYF